MNKELESDGTLKPNHLADAEAPTRAVILSSLPKVERLRVTENLVESAMTMGLTDDNLIKEWLGVESIGVRSIKAARERVTERWLEETSDIYEYAKSQRAMQIKKGWDEIRKCEELFNEAKTVKDKVQVKKLQLDWMQYISKLGLVDKMIEASVPDMQVVVHSGIDESDRRREEYGY